MKWAALSFLLLAAACVVADPLVERHQARVYSENIDLVRGAALISMTRMGLTVTRHEPGGTEQTLQARGDQAVITVALEAFGPDSTGLRASIVAEPDSLAALRFLDGVDAALR
jgi:hypothetical protein